MITLALDASMTRTGWSLIQDNDLLDFGAIRPTGLTYLDKAACLTFGLQANVGASADAVDLVIMEDIKGKHRNAKASVSSLIVLGQFITAMSFHVREAFGAEVELVQANQWTRGIPKEKRQKTLLLTCPEYADWLKAGNKDTGCDVADSIEMNQQWWDRKPLTEATR